MAKWTILRYDKAHRVLNYDHTKCNVVGRIVDVLRLFMDNVNSTYHSVCINIVVRSYMHMYDQSL